MGILTVFESAVERGVNGTFLVCSVLGSSR